MNLKVLIPSCFHHMTFKISQKFPDAHNIRTRLLIGHLYTFRTVLGSVIGEVKKTDKILSLIKLTFWEGAIQ